MLAPLSERMAQPREFDTERYVYDVIPLTGPDAWRMLTAAADGDPATIDALLARDPNLVHAGYWYEGPLHWAVREGHKEVVERLLGAGADPGRSRFGYSSWRDLLKVARERGLDAIGARLVAEMRARFDYDPAFERLAGALRSRAAEAVESVIAASPELVHFRDEFGRGAVCWATMTNQLRWIDRFAALGVDLDQPRADGATPLQVVLSGDYWWRFHRELPPTALQSEWAVLGYLLGRGATLTLDIAAALGDAETVAAMLRDDPESATRLSTARRSPLSLAAKYGRIEVVKLLLEAGFDPNQPEDGCDRGGAVFEAAAGNHLEVARLLLAAGGDPNQGADSSGCAMTIVSVYHADREGPMLDLLRRHGGDLPPYAWSDAELIERIRARPALLDDPEVIDELCGRGEKAVLDAAMTLDHDWTQRVPGRMWGDRFGGTPEMTRILLEHGVDPNCRDYYGQTPLHHSAARGDLAKAEVLLEFGAELDAADAKGRATPLAVAAESRQRAMVEWLLEAGADPTSPDEPDWAQPSAAAVRGGEPGIIALLG